MNGLPECSWGLWSKAHYPLDKPKSSLWIDTVWMYIHLTKAPQITRRGGFACLIPPKSPSYLARILVDEIHVCRRWIIHTHTVHLEFHTTKAGVGAMCEVQLNPSFLNCTKAKYVYHRKNWPLVKTSTIAVVNQQGTGGNSILLVENAGDEERVSIGGRENGSWELKTENKDSGNWGYFVHMMISRKVDLWHIQESRWRGSWV